MISRETALTIARACMDRAAADQAMHLDAMADVIEREIAVTWVFKVYPPRPLPATENDGTLAGGRVLDDAEQQRLRWKIKDELYRIAIKAALEKGSQEPSS